MVVFALTSTHKHPLNGGKTGRGLVFGCGADIDIDYIREDVFVEAETLTPSASTRRSSDDTL